MAPAVPVILALSIQNHSMFSEIHSSLLTKIKPQVDLRFAHDARSALQQLSEQSRPSAVLLTDEALTVKKYSAVWDAVLDYTRGGGTTVAMGLFSSFTPPDAYKTFFARAGLGWESGSYHRTTVVLNKFAVGHGVLVTLPPEYSQKALFVKNVAPVDMLYKTDEKSVTQSLVFASTSANVEGESPVTLAKVGDGKLGYVGDVNAEEESDAVILTMCGLSQPR